MVLFYLLALVNSLPVCPTEEAAISRFLVTKQQAEAPGGPPVGGLWTSAILPFFGYYAYPLAEALITFAKGYKDRCSYNEDLYGKEMLVKELVRFMKSATIHCFHNHAGVLIDLRLSASPKKSYSNHEKISGSLLTRS